MGLGRSFRVTLFVVVVLGARAFWVLETQKTRVASYYYTSMLLLY